MQCHVLHLYIREATKYVSHLQGPPIRVNRINQPHKYLIQQPKPVCAIKGEKDLTGEVIMNKVYTLNELRILASSPLEALIISLANNGTISQT